MPRPKVSVTDGSGPRLLAARAKTIEPDGMAPSDAHSRGGWAAMLKEIEIGYIRSFSEPQTLSLTIPDGKRGSGYNVVVGKNNSGKSTLIKLLRDLISQNSNLTIGQEARHDPNRPHLVVRWSTKSGLEVLSFDMTETGGLFKKTGSFGLVEPKFRYIPSRRPFTSEFNAMSSMAPVDYDRNDFFNRRSNLTYYDSMLSTVLAPMLLDADKKEHLIELLRHIDPRVRALDADNVGGKDVIRFQSAAGRWHPISDTGDGIVNSIRIVHTIMTSEPDSCVVIDEPELSLHPQIQRNLYNVLIDFSKSRQIVVVSHSPHFVAWKDISESGKLFRVFLDETGFAQVRSARREAFATVRRFAESNITNRKYFDAVCKELFFSDEAVLVEGPDDVHYISNYLEFEGREGLPLMGYGCGGAESIRSWLRLCLELGIKSAALYDGDKWSEFDNALDEFSADTLRVTSFILKRSDIRDKYKRDNLGKETTEIEKRGIFHRNGTIHEDARGEFELLIESMRSYFRSPQIEFFI
jgi:energy-coupling factor transporter ATP-binding protein EcfA2